MRFVFLLILFILPLTLPAQRKEQAPPKERTPVNQYDAMGKKHGMWWTSKPPRMGEQGITEFGNYDHGVRVGLWYQVDQQGDLVAIESYKNDVLDGEVKYYDRGHLYCIGHYRGLNVRNTHDTIVVMDPVTQYESYKVISTENGTMRHGSWLYYSPHTGELMREEEYQVDELIFKKDYHVSASMDTIYRLRHEMKMPHKKGERFVPPRGKRHSYTN